MYFKNSKYNTIYLIFLFLSLFFINEKSFAQISFQYELTGYSNTGWLFERFNPNNSSVDTLSEFPTPPYGFLDQGWRGFTCGCNYYYAVGGGIIQGDTLFGIAEISLTDGALNIVPVQFDSLMPVEIEYNPLDNFIYYVSDHIGSSTRCYLCKIDLSNGIMSIITQLPDGSYQWGSNSDACSINPSQNLLYCWTGYGGSYSVNLTTGVITPMEIHSGGNSIFYDSNLNLIFSVGGDTLGNFGIYKYDVSNNTESLVCIVPENNFASGGHTYDPVLHNYSVRYHFTGSLDDKELTYNVVTGSFVDSSFYIYFYLPPYYSSCSFTSVENISSQNNFNLYPNPATNQLTVESVGSNQYALSRIEITNSLGVTVYTESVNLKPKTDEGESRFQRIINLKSFPSGIYFIKLYFGDGAIEVKKFGRE